MRHHTWGAASIERLWQDLRFAVRQMVRNPGFTAVAVVTLGLGMGGTTAIFSVFNALVLNPLPYAEPQRLVWVTETVSDAPEAFAPGPHFREWNKRSRTLDQSGAYTSDFVTLSGTGVPERLDAGRASAGLLPMLGVKPLLGRHFLHAEDRPGGDRVMMLGYDLWQRRFGGTADIVGRAVELDDDTYQVIGVLPPDFRFFQKFALWMPLALHGEEEDQFNVSELRMIARLAPGVAREEAQAELETIRRLYDDSRPSGFPDYDGVLRVAPLQDVLVGDSRQLLLLLLGAVSLVLLIACANVANLLLSRAVIRQREFAVRAALGAGRLRLMRQVLTESLLLAVMGGGLGLLTALWLTGSLGRLAAPNNAGAIAEVASIGIDLYVLGFTALVALLTGTLFCLAPALQLSRGQVAGSLKNMHSDAGLRGRRLRHLLMMAEVALTIVLLAGAGLLIRSFINLIDVDPGYRAGNVLTVRMTLPEARYPKPGHREAFYREAVERVSAVPGVVSAAISNQVPMTVLAFRGWPSVPGRTDARDDEPPAEPPTPITIVSPQYFRTMGIPLRAGRLFADDDHARAPRVVILSEALARQFFPHEDAVGRRLLVPGPGEGASTVIGIIGDVRHEGLDRGLMPQLYVPLRQNLDWPPTVTLVLRAASDPRRLADAVRSQVQAVDPRLAVYEVQTMEQRLASSIAPRRVNLFLIGAFALLALTLASVGVYGMISYAVTQRTREIGIRLALGARSLDLLKLLVGQGMVPVAAGVVLGVVGAWMLTRVIAGLLFGVSATDPVVFVAAPVLVSAVALTACYIPARRAIPIDPTQALRHE